MKYYYYKFSFVKNYQHLGSNHEQTFKAIDYEHALKQAKKYASFKCYDDELGYVVVYKLECFINAN